MAFFKVYESTVLVMSIYGRGVIANGGLGFLSESDFGHEMAK